MILISDKKILSLLFMEKENGFSRTCQGLYRVQVDLMTHLLLEEKDLIMDYVCFMINGSRTLQTAEMANNPAERVRVLSKLS